MFQSISFGCGMNIVSARDSVEGTYHLLISELMTITALKGISLSIPTNQMSCAAATFNPQLRR
jgi:hypothetical protein